MRLAHAHRVVGEVHIAVIAWSYQLRALLQLVRPTEMYDWSVWHLEGKERGDLYFGILERKSMLCSGGVSVVLSLQ